MDTPGEVVGSTAEHKEEVIASPSVSIGKNEGEMEKPRRRRKKAKLKVDSDDDALEQAIKQAEEERAIEADLMVRVWKKRPEQRQCGRSLPSPVDGVGDCRGCGRSVEGRMMLRCQECSFVLCPRCIFGAILQDLVDISDLCPRQVEKMGYDSRAVYEVISAWVRG